MAIYTFPKDLNTSISPYMIFKAFDWKMRGKKNLEPQKITVGKDIIVLPVPTNGVSDSITSHWDQAAGAGSENWREHLTRLGIGKFAKLTGEFGKYYQTQRGQLVNDLAGLAFTGSEFRSFQFNFSLIPKNFDESNTINNIVKAFKRNSLPSYADWTISYPHFWTIYFSLPSGVDTLKLKYCVVGNFTVERFADGNPTLNVDGNPQKTDISLSITEFKKLDRTEFE